MKPVAEEREEKQDDHEKKQQMKLMMFMERSRKDYLEATEDSNQIHKVEKVVTHMHETMVGMLEGKIDARVRSIEQKLLQHLDKDQKGPPKEDASKTVHPSDVCGQTEGSATMDVVSIDPARMIETQSLRCRCYPKTMEQESAMKMVHDSLHKWPAFVEGPRSALAVIKFGVEVENKPLLIH